MPPFSTGAMRITAATKRTPERRGQGRRLQCPTTVAGYQESHACVGLADARNDGWILRGCAAGSERDAAKNDQVAQDTQPCAMGERPLPQLIELWTDNLGTTMYRPLNLGGTMIDEQVQQAVGQTGGPGASQDMEDLAGMQFRPPLQASWRQAQLFFALTHRSRCTIRLSRPARRAQPTSFDDKNVLSKQ